MLIVAGTVNVKPNHRDAVIEAAKRVVAATEQEEGCITYRFYEDISQPNRFLVYELWESPEHLAAHFTTEHMAVFGAALKDKLDGPTEIKRYDDVTPISPRAGG